MRDWNKNGKYDMQDAFINYHIYKSISENKQNESNSRDSDGVIVVIGVVLLIFGVLIIFA